MDPRLIIIDLGSIFTLSIPGIFILTFCPRVGFWNFLEEVVIIFFACSSSPSQAASQNTFTFWALLIVAVVPSGVLEIASWSIFYFELQSPLPSLRMFLFHLYYHYLAIPYQELVRGLCLSFIELCKINDRQNILNLHVQWIIKS